MKATLQKHIYEHLSDEEVLARSLEHPVFFEVIIDRYQEAFLRKARNILRNELDAEDVVQDAFVRIYSAGGKFKVVEGASFKSWGYKILVNQCFTAYQKKKKYYSHAFALDDELGEIIADQDMLNEQEHKLDTDYLLSLISKLPVMLGRVMKLHFIEGKPQAEVAKIEGVSENVVRVRIHRAKKELKKATLENNL